MLLKVLAGWHDDVIKWKHFSRYWPFVRGIHRSPVNSPHEGQWRGALMFSFICAWINGWVNNREAGDLRRHRAHYDVIMMIKVVQKAVILRLFLGWGCVYQVVIIPSCLCKTFYFSTDAQRWITFVLWVPYGNVVIYFVITHDHFL